MKNKEATLWSSCPVAFISSRAAACLLFLQAIVCICLALSEMWHIARIFSPWAQAQWGQTSSPASLLINLYIVSLFLIVVFSCLAHNLWKFRAWAWRVSLLTSGLFSLLCWRYLYLNVVTWAFILPFLLQFGLLLFASPAFRSRSFQGTSEAR